MIRVCCLDTCQCWCSCCSCIAHRWLIQLLLVSLCMWFLCVLHTSLRLHCNSQHPFLCGAVHTTAPFTQSHTSRNLAFYEQPKGYSKRYDRRHTFYVFQTQNVFKWSFINILFITIHSECNTTNSSWVCMHATVSIASVGVLYGTRSHNVCVKLPIPGVLHANFHVPEIRKIAKIKSSVNREERPNVASSPDWGATLCYFRIRFERICMWRMTPVVFVSKAETDISINVISLWRTYILARSDHCPFILPAPWHNIDIPYRILWAQGAIDITLLHTQLNIIKQIFCVTHHSSLAALLWIKPHTELLHDCKQQRSTYIDDNLQIAEEPSLFVPAVLYIK